MILWSDSQEFSLNLRTLQETRGTEHQIAQEVILLRPILVKCELNDDFNGVVLNDAEPVDCQEDGAAQDTGISYCTMMSGSGSQKCISRMCIYTIKSSTYAHSSHT
eukprot:m.1637955 g.1637955  ORF g.1637955 m.1637955 type:complete len:106 (-) comp26472_c0_seq1:80-397(-)